MEISVIPLGTKAPSVSRHVAKALDVLKNEKDIKYQLTPMGTIVEGDLEKLLDIARKMHESVFNEVLRVVTTIKIDDRRDKPLTMESKVRSLQEKIQTGSE